MEMKLGSEAVHTDMMYRFVASQAGCRHSLLCSTVFSSISRAWDSQRFHRTFHGFLLSSSRMKVRSYVHVDHPVQLWLGALICSRCREALGP